MNDIIHISITHTVAADKYQTSSVKNIGTFFIFLFSFLSVSQLSWSRISEPAVCPNCESLHTMALIHNRSMFTDKQMIKLQESPGEPNAYTCRAAYRNSGWGGKLKLLNIFSEFMPMGF